MKKYDVDEIYYGKAMRAPTLPAAVKNLAIGYIDVEPHKIRGRRLKNADLDSVYLTSQQVKVVKCMLFLI